MIRYAVLPPSLPGKVLEYFDSIRESIFNIFMEEYSKLSGITYEEVYPWLVPIAARKLSTDISADERNLLIQKIRTCLRTPK
ncbi:hypothetical protein J2TS4_48980 [Paenibacillus sp. J2TS4]|nr:hypothetical protein J2TS4_48980 [Paenibacillus sp. J2TS4]